MNELKAVIFDIDGTLIDNNDYHFRAWKQYLEEKGMKLSDEDYKANISGRTNHDAVQHIFKKEMSPKETAAHYLVKEKIYRELYAPDIKPIAGLVEFLADLKQDGMLMAIATSGIQVNIDFLFQHIPIKKYFDKIINSDDIKKGKPDPEIFITSAKALKVDPANCVVFEDSTAGVESGRAAGMKVVALTTTHNQQELSGANLIIDDYTQTSYKQLLNLLV